MISNAPTFDGIWFYQPVMPTLELMPRERPAQKEAKARLRANGYWLVDPTITKRLGYWPLVGLSNEVFDDAVYWKGRRAFHLGEGRIQLVVATPRSRRFAMGHGKPDLPAPDTTHPREYRRCETGDRRSRPESVAGKHDRSAANGRFRLHGFASS